MDGYRPVKAGYRIRLIGLLGITCSSLRMIKKGGYRPLPFVNLIGLYTAGNNDSGSLLGRNCAIIQ